MHEEIPSDIGVIVLSDEKRWHGGHENGLYFDLLGGNHGRLTEGRGPSQLAFPEIVLVDMKRTPATRGASVAITRFPASMAEFFSD